MLSRPYAELLRQARRASRRADEAEDLLQTVLVAAVEAGRIDLSKPENRRWLEGAIRHRAAFDARSAARRRRREQSFVATSREPADKQGMPLRFVDTLTPGLRTTALLALTGHTRPEIAWLQRLTDTALRERISQIRRRWRAFDGGTIEDPPGLSGSLAFGRIRRSLLEAAKQQGALLASHDPDGHLFVIGTSQIPGARQLRLRATQTTE